MKLPFSHTLVERLAQADCVAVLTGAGISAESGIPTFRDLGGLWTRFRPEDLANVQAFLRRPELVQKWYAHRRQIVEEKMPNPGHNALAEFEGLYPEFTLITQNVDRLHHRAGNRNVIELHGNILHNYCIDCGKPATETALAAIADGQVARCVTCQGLIRPDVVWFGESLPPGAFETAAAAANRAQVLLSIGTSGVVYPAADLPLTARRRGAYVAEINVEESAIGSYLDEVVLGKAGEVLPALLQAVIEWESGRRGEGGKGSMEETERA